MIVKQLDWFIIHFKTFYWYKCIFLYFYIIHTNKLKQKRPITTSPQVYRIIPCCPPADRKHATFYPLSFITRKKKDKRTSARKFPKTVLHRSPKTSLELVRPTSSPSAEPVRRAARAPFVDRADVFDKKLTCSYVGIDESCKADQRGGGESSC